MKKKKISKSFGFVFLIIAPLFYFLPDFTVVDLLPDVIGYILTVIGLTMLSDVCGELETARRRFMYLMILGAAKLVSVFVLFGLIEVNERPTAMLTVLFIFAVAEMLMLIPAYKALFDGLVYLGTREEGTAVFNSPYRKKPYKLSYSDTTKRRTVIFIVIKNVLAVLPEALSLSVDENFQSYTYNRYDDINYFRILGIAASLVFGIVWVVRIIRYYKAVLADEAFIGRLKEKYRTDVLPDTGRFVKRKALLAFILLTCGIVTTVDFYINGNDGFNILPDFIAALLLGAGVLVITDKGNKWRNYAVAACGFYAVLSAVTWIVNYRFAYEYTPQEVVRDVEANAKWIIIFIISIFEALVFAGTVFLIVLALKEVVKQETGYVPEHATIDTDAKAAETHKYLTRWLYAASAAVAVAAACGPFRIWSFSVRFNILTDISWLIESVVTGIAAAVFISAVFKVYDGIKEKYLFS